MTTTSDRFCINCHHHELLESRGKPIHRCLRPVIRLDLVTGKSENTNTKGFYCNIEREYFGAVGGCGGEGRFFKPKEYPR